MVPITDEPRVFSDPGKEERYPFPPLPPTPEPTPPEQGPEQGPQVRIDDFGPAERLPGTTGFPPISIDPEGERKAAQRKSTIEARKQATARKRARQESVIQGTQGRGKARGRQKWKNRWQRAAAKRAARGQGVSTGQMNRLRSAPDWEERQRKMGWTGDGPTGEGYQSPQDRAAGRKEERQRRLGGGGGAGTFEIRGPSSPVTTPRAAAGVERDIRQDDQEQPRRGGPATPGTGGEGASLGGEQAAQTFLTTIGSNTEQWRIAGQTFGEAASQAMKATEIQLNANIGPLTIDLTATDVLTQFKNVLMPSIEEALRRTIAEELAKEKGGLA